MKKLAVLGMLVAICTLGSQDARAQADLGFRSLGLRAGLVNVEDIDATFGVGAFANLGNLSPTIRLESYLDHWSKTQDVNGGGEVSVRDVVLGARGRYMFETSSPNVRPFAGAGLGLHFVHGEIDIPAINFGGGIVVPAQRSEDSSTKLGVDIGGGLEMPVNPKTDFVAEGWYTIVSDVGQLALKVGLAWRLGQ